MCDEGYDGDGSTCVGKHVLATRIGCTVEPPNKGQVGTLTNVRYSEVVLYWGVFAKNPLFYFFICCCISFIMTY